MGKKKSSEPKPPRAESAPIIVEVEAPDEETKDETPSEAIEAIEAIEVIVEEPAKTVEHTPAPLPPVPPPPPRAPTPAPLPPPPVAVKFARDPACASLDRHRPSCDCKGEARKRIA